MKILLQHEQNVVTPINYLPSGREDVGKVQNLFRDLNRTLPYIRAGGDSMRTFRYLGSLASMFIKHTEVGDIYVHFLVFWCVEIYLSIYLSTYLSIYLSIYSYINPPIHLECVCDNGR